MSDGQPTKDDQLKFDLIRCIAATVIESSGGELRIPLDRLKDSVDKKINYGFKGTTVEETNEYVITFAELQPVITGT